MNLSINILDTQITELTSLMRSETESVIRRELAAHLRDANILLDIALAA